MLDADTPLDMSTKAAREFYKIAIQPLMIPFDGDSKNIIMFQSQLDRRISFLWVALLNGEYHQYSELLEYK